MKLERYFKGKQKYVSIKPITSIGAYHEMINIVSEDIFSSYALWFRGHANKNYKLLPSLYRIENYSLEKEKQFRNSFRDRAKGFAQINSNLSEYEWYFIMQHYGFPTRLLDWTEGYLFALYFSLQLTSNDNSHIDPCIWIINPFNLNEISLGANNLIRTDISENNSDRNLASHYLDFEKQENDKYPIAISSTYSNERILRQKGCFTIHGTEQVPIENLFVKNKVNKIVQINIDRKSVNVIRKELQYAGISDSSIFPDLDGLSRELRNHYSI